jgi:FdhD protein
MAIDGIGITTGRFEVLRPAGKGNDTPCETINRSIAIEAPVALEYNGIGYAVMMATPIDLLDFATGFSLSEGLVKTIGQIVAVEIHKADNGWIVRVQITGDGADTVQERARQRVSESSCGLCGMENLEQVMRVLPPVSAQLDVSKAAIFMALEKLRHHQPLNKATGAMHAAAFCKSSGDIVAVREDVGRHNALDKLLGALALQDIASSSGFLLLTARCSFELVQKTIIANCPMLVTVSAATSLAVEQAKLSGLTLVSLARSDSFLRA